MAPPRTISMDELRGMVGQELGMSDWLAITQERINRFADATGDHQWIHTDPQRAQRESPYGTTIAHGFLSLSLLSYLVGQAVRVGGARMAINYGLNRVRFPAPLPAGSRIRARCALHAVEDIEGGVQATFSVVVEVEGGSKPCCVAEWLTRHYR
jgi:acyl dehydratase